MAVAAPAKRAITVRPVASRRDLNAFIKLPFRLHRGTPWVPPLISERRAFLDRDRNPFFEHAEAEYFLAERAGEVVGRISAHIDANYNRFRDANDGMFGFFECERDPETARALVETACEWVAERGPERILGPMDFTTNDECGLLVEGHDLAPLILQPWHPPHYRELLEDEVGLTKAMDLLMWHLGLGADLYDLDETSFHPMIHEMARKVTEEHGVTVRNMRKRDFEAELMRFLEVYNAAWERNWGFVPLSDREVRHQAKILKPILDERWAFLAERDGETLGAALTLPDINQVLARMHGRLLPLGWLRFLLGRRRIDMVRVFALGVKPEHQHLGIAAAFYIRHLETASPTTPVWHGETGWILEVNEPMNRAMEGMGGRIVKRYRIYERPLGG